MFAALLGLMTMVQETPTPTGWRHELLVHESFEDFFADGLASAYRAELNADAPVAIIAGHVHGGSEQIDSMWDSEPASRAAEWLNGFYESAELVVAGGFSEVLPSWNVACPPGTGMCFELRVRENASSDWSPWLYVGHWGDALPPALYLRRADPGGPRVSFTEPKQLAFEGGKIDVDFFTSARTFTRAQYRVRTHVAEPEQHKIVRLRRVGLSFSRRAEPLAPTPLTKIARLDVPFRSQKSEKAELANRICSPTSSAMVMAYRKVEVPTAALAERCFDVSHEIYGNWTRAVQGAYSFGVPGYVARFGSWADVETRLAAGQPLVISIAAKEGELRGAPYPSTDGHLLVVCGFDGEGGVFVNDPAAVDASGGVTVYRRDDLERVWLARGGTAYVFLPRER